MLYRVEIFRAGVGWGLHAMRTARRNGLKVIYTAGRCYVRGNDALAYFDRIATESEMPAAGKDVA